MSSGDTTITTHLGHAGWHDHEVRGVVVFDLAPEQASTQELLLLTLGIARDDARARRVIDLCAQAALNPDPRIPPMKLARLGSAYGGLLSGVAVALLGMQGSYVGLSSVLDAATFLWEIQTTLGWAATDQELDAELRRRRKAKIGIAGFGVPGRPIDERVEWLAKRLEDTGTGPQPFWQLFARIGVLASRARRRPNFGGAVAAALLDLGCTPAQVGAASCFCGITPLIGNALEGSMQAPRLLQALPAATTVEYAGHPPRRSPRAESKDPPGLGSGGLAVPLTPGDGAPRGMEQRDDEAPT